MAHTLSITDGTDTLNFNDGTNTILLAYSPASPETEEQAKSGLIDGGEFTSVNLRNPSETIELMLIASTKPGLQTLANSIEHFLFAANRRQRSKTGPKVYLQLKVDGEAVTWRSEILSARFVLDDSSLDMWANIKTRCRVTLTRRYFWEGAESELELSTSNASAATGGQTIWNHDDSGTGHDNWVGIAADQIEGTLPAPVRLELTNNHGAAIFYRNIYLSTNAFADPTNFTHILEGEDGGGLTPTVESTCSDGNYGASTFSTLTGWDWTLPGALLQKTGGRFLRILARFHSIGGDFYAQPIIKDADNVFNLYEGDEVFVDKDFNLVDLGSLPFPPSNAVNVSWTDMTLYIQVRASSSTTVALDFLQLTPTDSYVHLIQRGYSIADGDSITVDGIEDVVHTEGAPLYTAIAMPLLVFPNRSQRILILHDDSDGDADIDETFSIRAYYRPRRSSI